MSKLITSDMKAKVIGSLERLYNAGYNVGIEKGKALDNETVRQEGYDAGYTDGKAEGYTEGEADGKSLGMQTAYDIFWDNFQNYGKRTDYSYAFAYGGWNDNTYNPKYIIRPSACNNLFMANTAITDTKVTIDLTNPNGNQKFGLFAGATKLKTIKKLIVNERISFQSSSPMFNKCNSLEDIIFEGTIGQNISFGSSPLLSRDSMNNIFAHLKTFGTVWTETDKTSWCIGDYEDGIYPFDKIKVVLKEVPEDVTEYYVYIIQGDNEGQDSAIIYFDENGEADISDHVVFYRDAGGEHSGIIDVIASNGDVLLTNTYTVYEGTFETTATATFNQSAVDAAYTANEWRAKVFEAQSKGWTVATTT